MRILKLLSSYSCYKHRHENADQRRGGLKLVQHGNAEQTP